jgi:hypothetical protein
MPNEQVPAERTETAPAIKGDPAQRSDPGKLTVETLFKAVLRRVPEEKTLLQFKQLLRQGKSELDLLKVLANSKEFRAKRLVPKAKPLARERDRYNIATDTEVSKYWTSSVQALSTELRRPSADKAAFGRACRRISRGAAKEVYVNKHRRRLYELACVVNQLAAARGGALRVLDMGMSPNSFILRNLFPGLRLSVADRPSKLKVQPKGFHSAHPIDLEGELKGVDLGAPYDLIIFAEVIGHLRVSPVDVLQFLIGQLADDGSIFVTTPNLFSRHNLRRISRRRSPLPQYPRDYPLKADRHFNFRVYGMKDLLKMTEEAGGEVRAFWFSRCWDDPATTKSVPPDELRNLSLLLGRRQKLAVDH